MMVLAAAAFAISIVAFGLVLYVACVNIKIDKDLQVTKKELYKFSDEFDDFYDNEYIRLCKKVEKK